MERFHSNVTSTFARQSRDNRPFHDDDDARMRLPLPVRVALFVLILMALFGVLAIAGCGGGEATPEEIASADAAKAIGPPDCVNFPRICQ